MKEKKISNNKTKKGTKTKQNPNRNLDPLKKKAVNLNRKQNKKLIKLLK